MNEETALSMPQRLSIIALGVEDVEHSRRFYEALGWHSHSASLPAMPLFELDSGIIFALYSRNGLAEDAGLSSPPQTEKVPFPRIVLAHNVATKGDVKEILALAEHVGATILKQPQEAFWGGFHGYFADPDGHVWEICFNPFWPLDEKGKVLLPER